MAFQPRACVQNRHLLQFGQSKTPSARRLKLNTSKEAGYVRKEHFC